jgi:S1-C subfamily serine protease
MPPDPPPTAETRLSTGTGFFVAHDGSFVTSAHVIEDCLLVHVKADDGFILDARIAAKDTVDA